MEDAEVEVDAAADVAAGVNIIRNQFTWTFGIITIIIITFLILDRIIRIYS